MKVELYGDAWVPAARAFNARMVAGGWTGFLLPETAAATPRESDATGGIRHEHFVVVDGDHIRGGFLVQRQPFWIAGSTHEVLNCQSPLSEGAVDRRYASVASFMIRSMLKLNPLVFAVGMGDVKQPLPAMLRAMGWQVAAVPFLFDMSHPSRCLAELRRFRETRRMRAAATMARWTGAGWAATRLWRLTGATAGRAKDLTLRPVERWGDWSDVIWTAARDRASMIGVRTSATLERLYPATGRELRFRIEDGGQAVAWAVVLDTQMRRHRHFGDLRVGTILDCLAAPEYLGAAARAITRAMQARGVDLVVTNQSHPDWIRAFRRTALIPGPSNYLLAMSRALHQLLQPLGPRAPDIHITRGDGDGRIHL